MTAHLSSWRIASTFALFACLAVAPTAIAEDVPAAPAPAATEEASSSVFGSTVRIQSYNKEAEKVLQAALTEATFWSDADAKSYSGHEYDEIRLKPTDTGYVPMITGQGGMDFDRDVVAEIVFNHQDKLPERTDGTKAAKYLGRGYDSTIGAEYTDCYLMLDLTLFYATFTQRMYRRTDENKTVMWFEKLTPDMVSAETWAEYEMKRVEIEEGLSLRWAFSSILRLENIYGMFIVNNGDTHKTRITFISKLEFGDDAGFIARMGSQMKGVLRSGLKSGFVASVDIAKWKQEQKK
ncbi:MAG: hypothetical protein KC912_11360 [Proteobacteria bacterium]|nr:hypothetical protein [Pseudomonadota bacterium]